MVALGATGNDGMATPKLALRHVPGLNQPNGAGVGGVVHVTSLLRVWDGSRPEACRR
jgi:hypothetical protein